MMPRVLTFWILLFGVGTGNAFAQTAGTVSATVKVVNAKTFANVVVFLKRSDEPMSVEPPKESVVLDQRQIEFIPHVLPIIKGTVITSASAQSACWPAKTLALALLMLEPGNLQTAGVR
jgi:hypothetical protein